MTRIFTDKCKKQKREAGSRKKQKCSVGASQKFDHATVRGSLDLRQVVIWTTMTKGVDWTSTAVPLAI